MLGELCVTYCAGSTTLGRMLHRPPPLMRIFRPPSLVRSSNCTSAPARAANPAATIPAAPAPTTTTEVGGAVIDTGDTKNCNDRVVSRGALPCDHNNCA